MSFREPGYKLKQRRLTGVIVELVNGGNSARVQVKGTKRTLTVKCQLLRHHGSLDKVSEFK